MLAAGSGLDHDLGAEQERLSPPLEIRVAVGVDVDDCEVLPVFQLGTGQDTEIVERLVWREPALDLLSSRWVKTEMLPPLARLRRLTASRDLPGMAQSAEVQAEVKRGESGLLEAFPFLLSRCQLSARPGGENLGPGRTESSRAT